MTSCAQAIKNWESANGIKAEEATEIKLCAVMPPLVKMDKAFGALEKCEKLSLSTNSIDRMTSLSGMSRLRILSIGRNNIKKIEKLEDVSSTLEQLWISYNQISSLDGIACCTNLTTLYMSNNLIKTFQELQVLSPLNKLKEVLFIGNPMYDEVSDNDEARIHVLSYLPQVTKIDGRIVKPSELEAAQKLRES